MKKILIGIAAFFMLLFAAVIALPFIVDINDYRDDIEKVAEKSLRADVEIGRLELSFWPYLGVRVSQLSLKHLPAPQSAFAGATVLTQEKMDFQVHLKSLFHGKVIASLHLQEPSVRLIKNASGTNIADLLLHKENETLSQTPTTLPKWMNRILIEEIELTGASLYSTDQTVSPVKEDIIAPLDLRLSHIQLADPSKPIEVELALRYQNIPLQMNTPVWLNLPEDTVRVGEGTLHLASEKLTFAFMVKGFQTEAPSLDGEIKASELDLGALASLTSNKEKPVVSGKLQLQAEIHGAATAPQFAGSLSSAYVKYDVWELKNLKASWSATSEQAKLAHLDFEIFEGTGHAEGVVGLAPGSRYDVRAQLTKINITPLVSAMTGAGDVSLHLHGERVVGKEVEHVNGAGEVRLVDGKIQSMNLVQQILSDELLNILKLASVGTPQTVDLPGRQVEGTPFREIRFPFTIQKGRLLVDQMQLEHQDYAALFQGSVGFDRSLDLKGRFLLPPELSARLLPNERIRSSLVDASGKFVIPLQLTGTIMQPLVLPDVGYVKELAATAAQKALKQEVQQRIQEKIMPSIPSSIPEETKPDVPDVKEKIKDIFGR